MSACEVALGRLPAALGVPLEVAKQALCLRLLPWQATKEPSSTPPVVPGAAPALAKAGALLASTAAHFRLRDPKLLIRLGQSVGSNLDTFNLHQVGMVAEAFAVVGHHHRSLVGYIEQILLKDWLLLDETVEICEQNPASVGNYWQL
eukprot:s3855_g1.t1